MRYTPKFFRDGLPEWKRKKDPLTSRLTYRPLSFVTASLFANAGWSANAVSYLSAVVGVIGSVLFVFGRRDMAIAGAVLINLWLVLDCTDGNIARCVGGERSGDFADAFSSYLLVGVLCSCMGLHAYNVGGVIAGAGNIWIAAAGFLASWSDTMMRLVHHKYKEVCGGHKEYDGKKTRMGRIQFWVDSRLGIGGILPALVLISALAGIIDLLVVWCFIYYAGSCVLSTFIHIRRSKAYDMASKPW